MSEQQRTHGWVRLFAVPQDLTELAGPSAGVLRLPLSVHSSGAGPGREFDLADPAQRAELYEIVLTTGTTADQARYLNAEQLRALWPGLRLPTALRQAWEPLLAKPADQLTAHPAPQPPGDPLLAPPVDSALMTPGSSRAAVPVVAGSPLSTVARNHPAATPTLEEVNTVTRPATLEEVMAALDAQEAALGRMEERVGRLAALAGRDVTSVEVTRQHEVVQETDYEQRLQRERERLAEQDREMGR